ncbi:hypothetical protein CLU79DRAFT_818161 [Phycomyces nitens]|nr:hypothetical protein CLU79DRAFT_818161 [Phycomyces nitens]
MSTIDENETLKQRRNRPCENCRAHRRKCIVLQGMQCERCRKMSSCCLFKLTARPLIAKRAVPLSKKNRVWNEIWELEQEAEDLQDQLRALHITTRLTKRPRKQPSSTDLQKVSQPENIICECVDASQCTHLSIKKPDSGQWQLTLSKTTTGIQLQTNINTFSEMLAFVRGAAPHLSISPQHTLSFITKRSKGMIVTNRLLKIESIIRNNFPTTPDKQEPKKTIAVKDQNERYSAKMMFIDIYFSCYGMLNPILIHYHYYNYLRSNPNSLLSTAVAAFVGYSQCRHGPKMFGAYSREELSESFRKEGQELMRDALFDELEGPTLETTFAIALLSFVSVLKTNMQEARLYSSTSWRMVVQLKDKYGYILNLPLSEAIEKVGTLEVIKAETWRRMFYLIRYVEVYLYMMLDNLNDFSNIIFPLEIGHPTPLPYEMADPTIYDAVKVYCDYVRLISVSRIYEDGKSTAVISYRLQSGSLNVIPSNAVEMIENQLFEFWNSLSPSHRVSDQPMSYIQTDHIHQCVNTRVLYLNVVYYVQWLNLQTRIMDPPKYCDLSHASLGCIDGKRALIIVSMSSDAIVKLLHVLHFRLPCAVDPHLLILAIDAMVILKSSPNRDIRDRADQGLKQALKILYYREAQARSPLLPPSPTPNNRNSRSCTPEAMQETDGISWSVSSCPSSSGPESPGNMDDFTETGVNCEGDGVHSIGYLGWMKKQLGSFEGDIE